MRCRSEHDTRLLIAAADDIPIDLYGPDIDAIVDPYVESTAERHSKACFIYVKIADAEAGRKLGAIQVFFLGGYAEKYVTERLEPGIRCVVLKRYTAQKILYGRI